MKEVVVVEHRPLLSRRRLVVVDVTYVDNGVSRLSSVDDDVVDVASVLPWRRVWLPCRTAFLRSGSWLAVVACPCTGLITLVARLMLLSSLSLCRR